MTTISPTRRMNKNEELVLFMERWLAQTRHDMGDAAFELEYMRTRHKLMTEDLAFAEGTINRKAAEKKGRSSYYSDWFHLSGAERCLAEQFFSRAGFKPMVRMDAGVFKQHLIFKNGEDAHLRWQTTMQMAGILLAREDSASFTRPDFVTRGKADGIFRLPEWPKDKRRLFELKTIKDTSFAEVRKTGKPLHYHITQANGYMFFLGLDEASIVYEVKGSHQLSEFVIKFDPDLFDYTYQRRADEIERAVMEREVPEREYAVTDRRTGTQTQGRLCQWCDFQHVCFNQSAIEDHLHEDQAVKQEQRSRDARETGASKSAKPFGTRKIFGPKKLRNS